MKIVFATNNKSKLAEVKALVPDTIEILSLAAIDCHEEIPETSPTIEGNAIQKAQYVFDKYQVPCFADDTGLEVATLNGEPGVISARYAGEQRSAEHNMNKLLQNLKTQNDRSARFKTVIALVGLAKPITFTGICKGIITESRSGKKGFGYDPIFQPEGYQHTFAQMDLAEKNKIGHRGKAVQQLIQFLENEY